MNQRTICAATAAILLSAGPASATLLSYEAFDYSPGDVHGQGGGTGFHSAWDAQDGFSHTVSSGSLAAGGLETTGNRLTGGNSWRSVGRRLSTGNASVFANAGLVSDVWTNQWIDQATLFFSFLMRRDGNDPSTVTFSNSNTAWFSDNQMLSIGNEHRWHVRVGGQTTYSTIDTVVGETMLIVGRLQQDPTGFSSLDVWFNPSSLGGTPPAPNLSLTNLFVQNTRFKSLAYYGGNGTGQGSLDEIRLGTTYGDVTPEAVPEPATLAVLALGAAAAAARRRKA